jgi:hypothetical protein
MAMKILKENPNIANNPNAQNMINVIQSGDEKKGQEIADVTVAANSAFIVRRLA